MSPTTRTKDRSSINTSKEKGERKALPPESRRGEGRWALGLRSDALEELDAHGHDETNADDGQSQRGDVAEGIGDAGGGGGQSGDERGANGLHGKPPFIRRSGLLR